ncbi:hypothetical protein ZIOFF_020851 [Zingiber officinale]|uniref:Uncharacterized protein n=1 Tax=Zingiber officinale TaxID=94328 RepID=A0A8J5LLM0_ZINOF|nr:hypothetical protein ZIOFF_020851 [Zingiber officinale]
MGNCCLSPEAVARKGVKTFPRPHHDHGTSPLANKNHLHQNGDGHSKRMAAVLSGDVRAAHGAWFPPWLATHANYYKELATTHWKEHGQPVLDVLLQKVSEKSIQAQQFMEPHFESSKAVSSQPMTIFSI